MRNNLIEVDLQSETHRVRFDSPIDSVKIDGQKLNDIHDLAVKVDRSSLYIATLTKRIKTLAYIATFLAIMAVVLCSTIGGWLFINKDRISNALDRNAGVSMRLQNTNYTMEQKLLSLGWAWRDKQWVQIEK